MPSYASQRRYHSTLLLCRIVTSFLLCLCGFLLGGICTLLALLLFNQGEVSAIWPPSPSEIVFLVIGSLIGGGLGVWTGVLTELEWHKDKR